MIGVPLVAEEIMHFIRDRALAVRLREGAVPSKERLLYLISYLLLTTLMTSTALNYAIARMPNAWDYVIDAASLCL